MIRGHKTDPEQRDLSDIVDIGLAVGGAASLASSRSFSSGLGTMEINYHGITISLSHQLCRRPHKCILPDHTLLR